MEQILLSKPLLSTELFKDVVFFLFSEPGAMFDANTVRLITLSGTEYHFECGKELGYSEVAEYFPPLGMCHYSASGKSVAPQGWQPLYLGFGTHMMISDTVYSAYQKFAEKNAGTNKLFIWRKLVRLTLSDINGKRD